ncbi:MAG TPA: VCBS repeat-containing protein, partial [Haliscomenobacter sp.]|nr:VCBS repeat-containing protein [Haliscomenobacter sp.]
MKQIAIVIITLICIGANGCKHKIEGPSAVSPTTLFSQMPSSITGIDFSNQIQYTEEYNPYTFRNFFNGSGVGLGDINNDGLIDVFFCANMESNRLYLNKGNFQFEDITQKAGLSTKNVWSSGVAMVDINGDGLLDIYVCKSGKPEGNRRYNELFINNGDLTFTEKAAEYGLADLGLSSHAAFFDYDRDGDLDCYLLNNSIKSVGGYDLVKGQRNIRDKKGGNKLYRNEGNKFVDVSEKAGIYGSKIGFGLGVTIGDVNRDGWPDIYVSNDFFEKDYLYLNQKDGTFHEELEDWIQELSFSSMGADMADLNNDGHPEIFVTDMLPETEARMKTKTNFEDWNKYRRNILNGYYRQFTRNVLQRNNGDGTFSEIGRMAGVFATDWSWGALMADLDNDGQKDIFVANGLLRDLTDQDYINFYSDPGNVQDLMKKKRGVITKMVDAMPSQAIPNYAFANQGNFSFQNKAEEWGLAEPSFSNGSAYGDLDNDGDLDLVVNNINMPAFVYRNNADTLRKNKANYLSFELRGEGKNPFAIGAQVSIRHRRQTLFQELFPMRGFQSSVDYRLNFGLGAWTTIDTLVVAWPNGRYTLQTGVKSKQKLKLFQAQATLDESPLAAPKPKPLLTKAPAGLAFRHQENEFSDFDRDRLIYQMMSYEGPKMAKGDINKDGLEDIFIGGAKDQAGAIFIQQAGGQFRRTAQPALEADKVCEDMDAIFFDADGDRDLDLYVCSGGNEFSSSSTALIDRLYFNDGKGNFTKSNQILPTFQFESTSCVDAADVDGDGDQDLFVGVRLRSFEYGTPVNGYVLRNDGRGTFSDVTAQIAPQLLNSGLYTDGRWVDIDRDGDPDLVVSGTWMPVRIFKNDRGQLREITAEA